MFKVSFPILCLEAKQAQWLDSLFDSSKHRLIKTERVLENLAENLRILDFKLKRTEEANRFAQIVA